MVRRQVYVPKDDVQSSLNVFVEIFARQASVSDVDPTYGLGFEHAG